MKETTISRSVTWIHITGPKERDIEALKDRFDVHPIILEELRRPTNRSKAERHDGYLFLVYHLPIYSPHDKTSRRAEIDILATHDTLVTVCYEELEPLHEFEKKLAERKAESVRSVVELLHLMIQHVNEFSVRQLKHVEEKVQHVGRELFKDRGRELLEDISHIKRDILDFSLITVSQRAILESLTTVGTEMWGEHSRIYFSSLLGDFLKIHYLLESLKVSIESYSETISQLFQFKTSEVVRRFSILGFLTFPLILYTTIALEPTIAKSFISSPSDFWIVFGVVIVFVGVLAVIFRKKGWL